MSKLPPSPAAVPYCPLLLHVGSQKAAIEQRGGHIQVNQHQSKAAFLSASSLECPPSRPGTNQLRKCWGQCCALKA